VKTRKPGKSSSGSPSAEFKVKQKHQKIADRNRRKGEKATDEDKAEQAEAFKEVKNTMKYKKSPAYVAGKKDMAALLSLFSPHLCNHLALVWGLSRKTVHSNRDIYNYCEGFNDRLMREFVRLNTAAPDNEEVIFQCPV
jgi:hypothetical protein